MYIALKNYSFLLPLIQILKTDEPGTERLKNYHF
jgi:hypothetical protein